MELKPDFKKPYILANEMLVASRCITVFPFDVKEFVRKQTDLQFCSFKKAWEKYGLDCHDLGSDSAILTKQRGKNIVFYNQDEYDIRDPFNRLHETGHFLLGHKMNLEKEEPLYGVQEVEANLFAAQMLMPLQILREAQKRLCKADENFIMKNFSVSYPAAHKTVERLKKRFFLTADEKEFDDIIIEKYKGFIDRIAPKKREYYSCWDDPMQAERDSWY